MTLPLAAAIIVVACAITIPAMLLVRRRAPEGSYFRDGDRASGVFGMLASGFALLLAFVVFLAFQTYDDARAGAEAEATIVAQQVETAQFLPSDVSPTLTEQLVCYGRSVTGEEWDQLEDGTLEDSVNPWAAELFQTIREVEPQTDAEQSAYDRWHDQTAAREEARNDRVHALTGVVPAPLWVVLYLLAGVLLVYMLFFADPTEGPITQSMLMGGVTVVVTSLLLVLLFFNQPFTNAPGGLQPVAMERTLRIIDQELDIAELELDPPCDADGRPT